MLLDANFNRIYKSKTNTSITERKYTLDTLEAAKSLEKKNVTYHFIYARYVYIRISIYLLFCYLSVYLSPLSLSLSLSLSIHIYIYMYANLPRNVVARISHPWSDLSF